MLKQNVGAASRTILGEFYLQEEAGALGHKSESNHCGDARQRTDHHEHSPAVELVG